MGQMPSSFRPVPTPNEPFVIAEARLVAGNATQRPSRRPLGCEASGMNMAIFSSKAWTAARRSGDLTIPIRIAAWPS